MSSLSLSLSLSLISLILFILNSTQGFLEDSWTGPQILAHHLLLMLTSDLSDASKTCPNTNSLLHPKLYPGQQKVDGCVVDKLNRSRVSDRDCMRN